MKTTDRLAVSSELIANGVITIVTMTLPPEAGAVAGAAGMTG
jgi:hypothetical protein